tara:strand:- start:10 stop:1191 length:1182 start_codon:yes stop_codon:yes gene_type:complete
MLKDIDSYPQLRPPSAALILENGDTYWGCGIGPLKSEIGELCFNTSQTGYQEALTDPSYTKQIITFTFPHIGIVGTNKNDYESNKIYASGCVINQSVTLHSNWRAENDLDFFFKENDVPCIYNIDTRQLTRRLANKGACNAAIIHFGNDLKNLDNLKKKLNEWSGLKNLDLASLVSTNKNTSWNKSVWDNKSNSYKINNAIKYSIACFDFGIKKNILRNLYSCNLKPTIINAKSHANDVLNTNPDGVFLSNGPGDPFATAEYVVPVLKELIAKNIPIFGICLGHQILSIALGAKTKKMFQGHRGANHPVKNIITSEVEITSQNHGFEVDRNSLSDQIKETHVSLFDGTNEGIKHKSLPVFSVQYHPEASPGPHDSHYLFKEFYNLIKKNAEKN